MNANQQVEQYLSSLQSRLAALDQAQRQEILREIEAHIRDAAELPNYSIEKVLQQLGSPADLAADYRDNFVIERASRSFSPVSLLRGTLRAAARGSIGLLAFLLGFVGYLGGLAFIAVAVIKPILPLRTGVWVANGRLKDIGVQMYVPKPPLHEVAGWWFIPLAVLAGMGLVFATTYAIRAFLRTSARFSRRIDSAWDSKARTTLHYQ
jgi:uncharacterized membrane protein